MHSARAGSRQLWVIWANTQAHEALVAELGRQAEHARLPATGASTSTSRMRCSSPGQALGRRRNPRLRQRCSPVLPPTEVSQIARSASLDQGAARLDAGAEVTLHRSARRGDRAPRSRLRALRRPPAHASAWPGSGFALAGAAGLRRRRDRTALFLRPRRRRARRPDGAAATPSMTPCSRGLRFWLKLHCLAGLGAFAVGRACRPLARRGAIARRLHAAHGGRGRRSGGR